MPTKHRLPQTFPHRVIFVASMTLCLCALGGVVVAVLSWNNRVWGYYFGTGFWSGGIILMAGIFGIVASCVRNDGSVKAFMIFAIFGFVVSLAMIALSCGGLDPDSGFYNGYPDGSLWNTICHGAYLGLGVLQLAICILSDAISFYYLFVERHAEIYSVKLRGKGKPLKRSRPQSIDKNRSSTASTVPLVGGSTRSKSGSRNSKKRKSGEENSVEKDDTDMPIKRTRGSFVKSQNGLDPSSPIRSPCVRPPSFSTFGHSDVTERESLIVHPDDIASVADTTRSQMSDNELSHYAQAALFEPPLPIEEDEELPPYEIVDKHSYTNVVMRINTRECPESELPLSGYQIRRANSAPLHSNKSALKRRREFKRSLQVKLGSVPSREGSQPRSPDSGTPNEFAKYIIDRPDLSTRLSHSADRLNNRHTSNENFHSQPDQTQGVQLREFSRSSDRITDTDGAIRENRSQSVRVNRESRLDRRRRALSVELKPSKHQRLDDAGHLDLNSKAHPAYDSTSALFAGTKTLPSKFSLRTRLSQKGARSAVPVKSVTSLPLFAPPRKPPRTHSVTLDDFQENTDNKGENHNKGVGEVKNVKQNNDAVSSAKENPALHSSDKKVTADVPQQDTVDAIKETKYLENEVKSSKNINLQKQGLHNEKSLEVAKSANVPSEIIPVKLCDFPDDKTENEVDEVFISPKTATAELGLKQSKKREQTSGITIDSGPVVKLKMPVTQSPKLSVNTKTTVTSNSVSDPGHENSAKVSSPISSESSIVLPLSPVIRPPVPSNVPPKVKENIPTFKPEPIYSKINKKPPEIMPKPHAYRLSTGVVNTATASNASKGSNNASISTKPQTFPEKDVLADVDLRVRPSPLSPSEKILQKINDRPVINAQGTPANVERKSVEVGRNLFLPSTEYSGARPKTSIGRRSYSEDPDERPIRPLVHEDPRKASYGSHNRPVSFSSSKVSPSQPVSPLPQPFHYKPKFSFVYPSNTSPKSPVSPTTPSTTVSSLETVRTVNNEQQGVQTFSKPAQPSATVQLTNSNSDRRANRDGAQRTSSNGAQRTNSNGAQRTSSNDVNNGVQGTNSNDTQNGARVSLADTGVPMPSGSASSQGVLHLPQSQYPRQVADNRDDAAPVGAVGNGGMANAPPQPVPLQQQNIEEDGDKPLFSVLL